MSQAPSVPPHIRRDAFDPSPDMARLRAEAPVSLVDAPLGPVSVPAWLVTRYEDVREVLGDTTAFSNAGEGIRAQVVAEAGEEVAATLLTGPQLSIVGCDPPDHTRLRRMVAPRFTVKRMLAMRPRIETIVTDHLDAMAERGGPVDLVQEFALPIPSLVICELLGVPYADRADFQRRVKALVDIGLGFEERAAAVAENRAYMTELVRRERSDPGDGLIGALVREHGDELPDHELVPLARIMLNAGHETTANMLALGTLLLLRHPGQLALLRDDPTVTDRAVEELMRYLTIAHSVMIRTATRDVVIGGKHIKAGEAVVCSLPSANRDGAVAEEPDDFDITREPTSHVAFGHGIHHCLGAPLARLEMRVAFPALLRRFPALRLAVPFEEIRFRSQSLVYGVEALPITW